MRLFMFRLDYILCKLLTHVYTILIWDLKYDLTWPDECFCMRGERPSDISLIQTRWHRSYMAHAAYPSTPLFWAAWPRNWQRNHFTFTTTHTNVRDKKKKHTAWHILYTFDKSGVLARVHYGWVHVKWECHELQFHCILVNLFSLFLSPPSPLQSLLQSSFFTFE